MVAQHHGVSLAWGSHRPQSPRFQSAGRSAPKFTHSHGCWKPSEDPLKRGLPWLLVSEPHQLLAEVIISLGMCGCLKDNSQQGRQRRGEKGGRKRREKKQEGEGRERGGESKEKGRREREKGRRGKGRERKKGRGNREIHKERKGQGKGQSFCNGISVVTTSCHFCSLPFVRSE